MIESLFIKDKASSLSKSHERPHLIFGRKLNARDIEYIFQKNRSNSKIGNYGDFGAKYLNADVRIRIPSLSKNSKPTFVSIEPAFPEYAEGEFEQKIAEHVKVPVEYAKFYRLGADRNMVPEDDGNLAWNPDGTNGTRFIFSYLSLSSLPRHIVENEILNDLNEIMGSDANFSRIVTQKEDNGTWQVYLEEDNKGLVPLSKSGSGLKTIILMLALLRLVPDRDRVSHEQCVFALEELENNLHPAVQRRLFQYIRDFAVNTSCTFFITTHSGLVIDLFWSDPDAQILHVSNNGFESNIEPVSGYTHVSGVLDDIGLRASDILQANGIVWCEGPSDAIYIQRWIELWSEDQLIQGIHYQCLFYGGGLVRFLDADRENASDDKVNILFINRNCVFIGDSDCEHEGAPLKPSLSSIISQLKLNGIYSWITAGREIEQYLPQNILDTYFSNSENRNKNYKEPESPPVLGRYEKFDDYQHKASGYATSSWPGKKVSFARTIAPQLTKEDLVKCLDLSERMDFVVALIRKWNGM